LNVSTLLTKELLVSEPNLLMSKMVVSISAFFSIVFGELMLLQEVTVIALKKMKIISFITQTYFIDI
jgi:hypothetical protein